MHERIPTRKYLANIGINIDEICPVSRKYPATASHAATFLPQDAWLVRVRDLNIMSFSQHFLRKDLFAFVKWGIWVNRNFNNHNTSLNVSLTTIIRQASKFKFFAEKSSSTPTKHRIHIRWRSPHKGWFKLNVDGSYMQNKSQGGI